MIDANITFEQPEKWTTKSYDTVLAAVYLVGTALMPFMDRRMPQDEVFYSVFGNVKMRFTSNLATWAHASYGVVRFRPGYVILPLVVHEMGHLFGVRAKNMPSKLLVTDKLDTRSVSLWPGMHPTWMAGYSPIEAWANLFADWVMDMLPMNPAGDALRAWFGSNMGAWVATARAQR